MKEKKLMRWELALLCGVLLALVTGVELREEQKELADALIRLHVVANSDSQEDQRVKLLVRDALLEQVGEWSEEAGNVEEMEARIRANLPLMEGTAREVLEGEGLNYPVRAMVTRCRFPTREYGDFALPAGEYTALRLELGGGEGENWWCVAFPPLCVGGASMEVEQACQAGLFTGEQQVLLTRQGEEYVLRFRLMELLGELENWLRGGGD